MAWANPISSWPDVWDNNSMPFTLSHPAAILPLRRKGLVFSALVIGSMAPDFNYFIPYMPEKSFTHSIPGIFLFCIPVGFIVLFLFHKTLKQPFLSLLPENHRLRLLNFSSGFSFLPPRRLFLILFSMFLGVLTHLLWDSFTHLYGWGVIAFPFFQQPLIHIGSRGIALYTVLQHLSTAIGLVIIGAWYWKWYQNIFPIPAPHKNVVTNRIRIGILFIMLLTAFLSALISAVVSIPDVQSLHQIRLFAGQIAIISITTLVGEILIYSCWWHYKNHNQTSI